MKVTGEHKAFKKRMVCEDTRGEAVKMKNDLSVTKETVYTAKLRNSIPKSKLSYISNYNYESQILERFGKYAYSIKESNCGID